jgi:hypothetical protein
MKMIIDLYHSHRFSFAGDYALLKKKTEVLSSRNRRNTKDMVGESQPSRVRTLSV